MARHKLTDSEIKAAKKVGVIYDGDGLYLRIRQSGGKTWLFVWRDKGLRKELSLGQYGAGTHPVSLARARAKAEEARTILAAGGDPKTDMADRKAAIQQVTFGKTADDYIAAMSPKWTGRTTLLAFQRFANTYAAAIRDVPVATLSTDDVLSVIRPMWHEKPETARKVRERIKQVLDFAKAKQLRSGDNPAEWRGHLDQILPANEKLSKGHHASMPYAELPAFVAKLRAVDGIASRALEFIALTAARSSEAREAEWSEIDLQAAVWTVPGSRMKSGKEHRVPLTARAVQIVSEMQAIRLDRYVFTGKRHDRPISDMSLVKVMKKLGAGDFTIHGFRSSFRDWAGNETNFARELAEQALAHAAGDATEIAYRRQDALEKRRVMMGEWTDYVEGD
jgi:integrase